jgi:hypothetical protein
MVQSQRLLLMMKCKSLKRSSVVSDASVRDTNDEQEEKKSSSEVDSYNLHKGSARATQQAVDDQPDMDDTSMARGYGPIAKKKTGVKKHLAAGHEPCIMGQMPVEKRRDGDGVCDLFVNASADDVVRALTSALVTASHSNEEGGQVAYDGVGEVDLEERWQCQQPSE